MPDRRISSEEFEAELRRHGLVPTDVQSEKMRVWATQDRAVFVIVRTRIGFIPESILIQTLRQAGIEFRPNR